MESPLNSYTMNFCHINPNFLACCYHSNYQRERLSLQCNKSEHLGWSQALSLASCMTVRGHFHLTVFSFLTYKLRGRLNNHLGFFLKPLRAPYFHRSKILKKEKILKVYVDKELIHKPNFKSVVSSLPLKRHNQQEDRC